jgi:multidrug efflux pump
VLGRFFAAFNRFFGRASHSYEGGVKTVLRRKAATLGVYLALGVAAVFMFRVVPPGFVPAQDKYYLVGIAQLPTGASLDRVGGLLSVTF